MSIHRAMSYLPLVLLLTLLGCNGGGAGGNGSGSGNTTNTNADQVRTYATSTLGLTGDPAAPRGATQTVPDNNPLVKLGELLFFSQTLSANYDVSCGTCHHPDFGGGDGLSLSVGVDPVDASAVDHIVERCTEYESGGRMIDALLTNTLLPRMSREILTRLMEDRPLTPLHLGIADGRFAYDFESD